MAFNGPGVPSNGTPRSRARTIFFSDVVLAGGDCCGWRASTSTKSSQPTHKATACRESRNEEVDLRFMKKTSNAERSTSNVQSKNPVILSTFFVFCFRLLPLRIRFEQ